MELQLQCHCGQVQGSIKHVSAASVNRDDALGSVRGDAKRSPFRQADGSPRYNVKRIRAQR